jgi:hypothetical protein
MSEACYGLPRLRVMRRRADRILEMPIPIERTLGRNESNDENLEIDETCIMILKGAGPKGYPGKILWV